MDFEPSEHEPEEYDPEAELRDPDSGSVTIPEVSTAETDVPPDLLKAFWGTVLAVNGAVLGLSVGLLLVVFRGDLRRGGILLVGGLVLLGFAYRRYRSYRLENASDDAPDGSRSGDGSETGDSRETGDTTGAAGAAEAEDASEVDGPNRE